MLRFNVGVGGFPRGGRPRLTELSPVRATHRRMRDRKLACSPMEGWSGGRPGRGDARGEDVQGVTAGLAGTVTTHPAPDRHTPTLLNAENGTSRWCLWTGHALWWVF